MILGIAASWRLKQGGVVTPGDNLRGWPAIGMPGELLYGVGRRGGGGRGGGYDPKEGPNSMMMMMMMVSSQSATYYARVKL